MLPNGLTVREARFVDEYLLDFNATKAAMRARYSERSAYSIGSELLHNPKVAAAIAACIAERSTRTKIDTDWVVQQLREQMAEALAAGDRGVAFSCTNLLAKHVGGFAEKHEHTGKNGEAIAHAVTVRFVRPDAPGSAPESAPDAGS
jgi:phage terminase small subunit